MQILFFLQAICTDTDLACQKSALLEEYNLDVSTFQQAFPNIQNKILTGALIASCAATVYHYIKHPCPSIAYGATFTGCLSLTLGEIIEYIKYKNRLKDLTESLKKKFENPKQQKEDSFKLQTLETAIASEELTRQYFKNKTIYYIIAGSFFLTATIAPFIEPIHEPTQTCNAVVTSPVVDSFKNFSFISLVYASGTDFFSAIGSISQMMSLFKIKNIFPFQEKISKLSAQNSASRTAFAGVQTAASTMSILAFNQLKNQAQSRQQIYQEQFSSLAGEKGNSLCNNLPCDLQDSPVPGIPKITDEDFSYKSAAMNDPLKKLLNQQIKPEDVDLKPYLANLKNNTEDYKKSISPQTNEMYNDYPSSPIFNPGENSSISSFENFSQNTPAQEFTFSSPKNITQKSRELATKSGAAPQSLFFQIEQRHQKYFQKGTKIKNR